MTKKLFIKTYGCQSNAYDSQKMLDLLLPLGFEEINSIEGADLVILNTCHIRNKASEKVYHILGRIKPTKKQKFETTGEHMRIVVAGCVAQGEGEQIFTRSPHVDIVVGPQSYYKLPELLSKLDNGDRQILDLDFDEQEKFDKLPEELLSVGPSACIAIQEGCDKFCHFCVVPYTRGAEFSRSVDQIYQEALQAALKGAIEIVLLGQNVNAYHGKKGDGTETDIADLISIISSIPSIQRIRYTTSHPLDMTKKLIYLHRDEPKLMPFLHLPIQSGSNKILKKMNRKYTREYYEEIVHMLRELRQDIVISSDFIVGFPEETDEDFADTLHIVQKLGFPGQSYPFKYSPRPGTPAATRPQIPEHIKSQRLIALQQELTSQQKSFNASWIGKVMPVLFNKEGKFSNQVVGKTPYMQSVYIEDNNLHGQIIDIKITQAFAHSMTGVKVNNA